MKESEMPSALSDADIAEKFWRSIQRSESCWLWAGTKTGAGYAVLATTRQYGMLYAHRWAFETFKGEIPEGCEIDHLCRVCSCVNPDHLEAVPHKINVLRGVSPMAANATKTHCPKGHLYDLLNTFWQGPSDRVCRTCKREREIGNGRRYRARKRALA